MSINLEARCIWRRADVAVNQSDEKNFVRFPKRLQKWQIVEALIDSNAKVDPKFTTTNIETKAGLAMTGFVEKEDDDTLTLKIAGGIVQAYKKADLRKRENLKQSSMPEGLGNTMSAGGVHRPRAVPERAEVGQRSGQRSRNRAGTSPVNPGVGRGY